MTKLSMPETCDNYRRRHNYAKSILIMQTSVLAHNINNLKNMLKSASMDTSFHTIK